MTALVPAPGRHVLTLAELDENPWASCGPAALAALLGRPLAEIRHAFSNQQEGRTWTNLRQMLAALDRLDQRYRPTPWREGGVFDWPARGLVLIQFRGSWDAMPVNHPAQLQRSHWITVAQKDHPVGERRLGRAAIFDVNHLDIELLAPDSGWVAHQAWEQATAPMLAEGFGKKATGTWWVRSGLEIA